jgi:hypothetical protein
MRKLHPHQQIAGLSGLTAEDFWIWAYSDMLNNVVRNAFAEFMVGFALGRLHTPKIGQESIEFNYRDKKVVVKAASYVQSQEQTKKSKINFDVAIKKDKDKPKILRTSDCYVFCLFTFEGFEDKDTARNALIDTTHWRFYVLPTELLNQLIPKKKTVGVRWMNNNCPDGPVGFDDLKVCIDQILGFPT